MPIVTPKEPYNTGSLLLALCVWREARGECHDAKRGVVHTVYNRMSMAPAEGFKHDITGNVLKPWAFSSFMSGDPNADKYPEEDEAAWVDCLRAVMDPGDDPTDGAVFYYSRPITAAPKAWGSVEETAVIGGLTFCRIAKSLAAKVPAKGQRKV